jgi:hypothetical protein
LIIGASRFPGGGKDGAAQSAKSHNRGRKRESGHRQNQKNIKFFRQKQQYILLGNTKKIKNVSKQRIFRGM